MKKTVLFLILTCSLLAARAQQTYWVFLTDKAGTTFDPYAYFDAKAIERYAQVGADLFDPTNYPVSPAYEQGIAALADQVVGSSRWLNAVGVEATPSQVQAIQALPYVLRVEPIMSRMQHAEAHIDATSDDDISAIDSSLDIQLQRMQGGLFRQAGIDGHGIRIAVFDGGFPRVNTHDAFAHLRNDHRILHTWNFPNRKEDVYGWNSHGTMTLSCIAGRKGNTDIGLATGAEFLLARTEIESEPFKEEIWWMQAVEWADKYGANIISSSLGYGKDRYYTNQMDGTSYVARAANLAARKGILVVNSAGNEADDNTWMYIITPSDADSVLCIGGIERTLTEYNHISFASVGPSADGRQKPNLCAFGHAMAAATGSDHAYNLVYGTSFSCPLVAGFAACAWQASPGLTNMQLFDALQRSADLYPYCDYTFGYGVPQASYFVGQAKAAVPTFRFEEVDPTTVKMHILAPIQNTNLFYKNVEQDGHIDRYGRLQLPSIDSATTITFYGGTSLVVNLGGYTAQHNFTNPTPVDTYARYPEVMAAAGQKNTILVDDRYGRNTTTDVPKENRSTWDFYFTFGLPISFPGDGTLSSHAWSPAGHYGIRYAYSFTKAYSVGIGIELGGIDFRYNGRQVNPLEQVLRLESLISNNADNVSTRRLRLNEFGIELFQRVRLVPGGMLHQGLHWDLGIYGTMGGTQYRLQMMTSDADYRSRAAEYYSPSLLDDYFFNYGITTRLTYDIIGLYARLRLNDIWKSADQLPLLLPRLEAGIQIRL